MRSTLFRQEALEHSPNKLNGNVVLNTPPSFVVLTVFFITISIITLVFIAISKFSDQKIVTGYLVDNKAVIQIYPTANSIIKSLLVTEGDEVKVGQALAVIRVNSLRLDGLSNEEQQRQEIKKQLKDLKRTKKDTIQSFVLQKESLNQEVQTVLNKIDNFIKQETIIEERVALSKLELSSKQGLAYEGLVSKLDISKAKSELLKLKESLLEHSNKTLELKKLLMNARQNLKKSPIEERKTLQSISTEVSSLTRQLLEMSDNIEYVIQARNGGVISNVNAKEGEFISVKYPLLTITPSESELLAELLVPSRAIAFIELGQDVFVRFDAFPNQVYGEIKGQVSEISQSVLQPEDWDNPISVNEPIYRVRVSLQRQSIVGRGKNIPLKRGLRLQADIVLENQSFLMYMLEPLLELKKSLR